MNFDGYLSTIVDEDALMKAMTKDFIEYIAVELNAPVVHKLRDKKQPKRVDRKQPVRPDFHSVFVCDNRPVHKYHDEVVLNGIR